MIIENIETGQRFEVADGTHFPTHAYRVVTPDAPKPATPEVVKPKLAPTVPSVVKPKAKPAAKKKPAKKKTKKSKK